MTRRCAVSVNYIRRAGSSCPGWAAKNWLTVGVAVIFRHSAHTQHAAYAAGRIARGKCVIEGELALAAVSVLPATMFLLQIAVAELLNSLRERHFTDGDVVRPPLGARERDRACR